MPRPAFALSLPLCPTRHTPNSFKSTTRSPTTLQTPSPNSTPSPVIPGTPCFTPNILSTPMPLPHRHMYLQAVETSLQAYLANLKSQPHPPRAKITLLPPQLNPELDVYDRRFLLQLVWAALSASARQNMHARVLIQGPRAFGAVPLSVAGLRRTFDADLQLSKQDWPITIRSGELENPRDVDDDDDVIFVLSPTNAVSIPVTTSIEQLVQRINNKPLILINPRLYDVPSHSGVMQVSGRAQRLHFLSSFQHIFYFKLLFKTGTGFPPLGILYYAYPHPWQVWRSIDNTTNYNLILESQSHPDSELINNAFSRDTFQRQKQRLQQLSEQGTIQTFDAFFTSPQLVVFLIAVTLLSAAVLVDSGNLQLLLHFASGPVPK